MAYIYRIKVFCNETVVLGFAAVSFFHEVYVGVGQLVSKLCLCKANKLARQRLAFIRALVPEIFKIYALKHIGVFFLYTFVQQ